MTTIAKGMITLVNVNDAYSVTVTPSTCAIKADFDGTNPILDEAYCDMSVVRGNIKVPFTITSHIPSNTGIKYSFSGSEYVRRMRLTAIPSDVLSGNITMDVATKDEYVAQVIFQYSVVREATMLDWIKDWEGGKTKIGGTYIMTPKIFIGRKSQYQQYEGVANSLADIDNLTGVYIGPNSASTGIYGYKNSNEIFHINESGGMIGGWSIENGGIQSEDGNLKLLAEGSIEVRNAKQDVVWGIYSNGSAKFAKGNVIFNNDGSAYFAGKISATSGKIGGFSISSEALSTDGIAIDGTNKVIAVYNGPVVVDVSNNLNIQTNYYTTVKRQSGVMMYYNNANDYGLAGYVSAKLAFSVGAENKIAGWNFDETAIYTGVRNNTLTGYTTEGITLGTNGLRGLHFYIDSTGAVSFADGKFTVAQNGDTQISGWSLFANRLSTKYAAIVSDSNLAGLFLSASDIAETATTGLLNTIQKTGGIYLMRDSAQASLSAYGNDGTLFFRLSNTKTNVIAGWNFYGSALYKGTLKDVSGQFTTASGDITIGETGIRGFRWQLNADGSGSIAGGNISWNASGSVSFSSNVTISFSQCKDDSGNSVSSYLTNIGLDGIYTGTIHANEGYIGAWHINSDKQIVSTLSTNDKTNRIVLDASLKKISLFSDSLNAVTGIMGAYSNIGSVISIDANNGIVETRAKRPPKYSSAISYISPTGVFSNFAGTRARSFTTGRTHQGAIVGLGLANIDKTGWNFRGEEAVVAGVYGRALNYGTAPAFGGYFWDLKACGCILNRQLIADSSDDGTAIDQNTSLVIGLCNKGVIKTVYLPSDGVEGRIIIVRQMGAGAVRVDTFSGQKLYDDTSENDYFQINTGQMGIFIFGIWTKGDATTRVETMRVWTAKIF